MPSNINKSYCPTVMQFVNSIIVLNLAICTKTTARLEALYMFIHVYLAATDSTLRLCSHRDTQLLNDYTCVHARNTHHYLGCVERSSVSIVAPFLLAFLQTRQINNQSTWKCVLYHIHSQNSWALRGTPLIRILWNKDSSIKRTAQKGQLCILHTKSDTSLNRTFGMVPRVSGLEGSHCSPHWVETRVQPNEIRWPHTLCTVEAIALTCCFLYR